jgi:SAM-dependent methyltransferase
MPCCPTCGAGNPSLLGSLPDSEWFAGKHLATPLFGGFLFCCPQCRLKFRFPLQSSDMYRALYDNATTGTWAADAQREDWDLILAKIESLKPGGGRVLDFGCYTGGLLARLNPRHERFGIEINRDAAGVARERTGASVWSTINDVPSDLRFDAIVLSDVVEHVADPKELLDLLGQKLTRDGVVIVTTGDADNDLWNRFGANWWYCFYPEHISFISRAWVERTLRNEGWSIVDCRPFRYRRIGRARRLAEHLLAYAYGWFPRSYLNIGKAITRWSGRGPATSVPGNGAIPDHLLLVVSPTPRI